MIVKLKLYDPQNLDTGRGISNILNSDKYLTVYSEHEHDYAYVNVNDISYLTSRIIDCHFLPRTYLTVLHMQNGSVFCVEGTVMSVMEKIHWKVA